jgi:hypothetical protein
MNLLPSWFDLTTLAALAAGLALLMAYVETHRDSNGKGPSGE